MYIYDPVTYSMTQVMSNSLSTDSRVVMNQLVNKIFN